MKDSTFLIGLLLILIGFFGFCSRAIIKVLQGDGLDYYFTGFGYQFNYIGALILFSLIPLTLVIVLFVRRYQTRDERDFKDRYKQ